MKKYQIWKWVNKENCRLVKKWMKRQLWAPPIQLNSLQTFNPIRIPSSPRTWTRSIKNCKEQWTIKRKFTAEPFLYTPKMPHLRWMWLQGNCKISKRYFKSSTLRWDQEITNKEMYQWHKCIPNKMHKTLVKVSSTWHSANQWFLLLNTWIS